jgi:hypothetical protein
MFALQYVPARGAGDVIRLLMAEGMAKQRRGGGPQLVLSCTRDDTLCAADMDRWYEEAHTKTRPTFDDGLSALEKRYGGGGHAVEAIAVAGGMQGGTPLVGAVMTGCVPACAAGQPVFISVHQCRDPCEPQWAVSAVECVARVRSAPARL